MHTAALENRKGPKVVGGLPKNPAPMLGYTQYCIMYIPPNVKGNVGTVSCSSLTKMHRPGGVQQLQLAVLLVVVTSLYLPTRVVGRSAQTKPK